MVDADQVVVLTVDDFDGNQVADVDAVPSDKDVAVDFRCVGKDASEVDALFNLAVDDRVEFVADE